MKRLEILDPAPQIFPWLIAVLERFQLSKDFFGSAGIVPEIRRAGTFFQFFYASAEIRVFKDASRFRGFGFLIQ